MGTHRLKASLATSYLCLLWIAALASIPPRELLGIAPQDEGYFAFDLIKCKDGSNKFTKKQLNDEYCDCPDGTDEPGTSACPEGKFYCRNKGHIPRTIFSSRVNDGVCDCCDGSDEYKGNANCPNTCWEAGKAAREKLKKKIMTHQDGLVIRKQEVEKAKLSFARDEAELLKLKNEEKILEGLVQKLRDHKERIEKAEEEERLEKEKEKEEKKQRDAERKLSDQNKSSEKSPEDHTEDKVFEQSSQDKAQVDNEPSVQLENKHKSEVEIPADHTVDHVAHDYDDSVASSHGSDYTSDELSSGRSTDLEDSPETTEGLSREDLGRRIASRWTGKHSEEQTQGHDWKDEELEESQDFPEPAEEENYDSYNSDIDEDRHKFNDHDFKDDTDDEYEEDHVESDDSTDPDKDFKTEFPDATPSGGPSWLEKIQQTVHNIIQAFNFFKTPVDIAESSRVKKEYDDANSKLSKIRSRISTLSEKLKHDFGKEKDFYSFYDRCFESKQNKYTYKVCPFKKASQVEGHSTTQLGRWENFDESYRVMQFSNGDRCWNGPDRSLKVRLRCGLKDELADVDEPSRCEYVAILSTPILCLEEKLKELQQKLGDLSKSQPSNHDEL